MAFCVAKHHLIMRLQWHTEMSTKRILLFFFFSQHIVVRIAMKRVRDEPITWVNAHVESGIIIVSLLSRHEIRSSLCGENKEDLQKKQMKKNEGNSDEGNWQKRHFRCARISIFDTRIFDNDSLNVRRPTTCAPFKTVTDAHTHSHNSFHLVKWASQLRKSHTQTVKTNWLNFFHFLFSLVFAFNLIWKLFFFASISFALFFCRYFVAHIRLTHFVNGTFSIEQKKRITRKWRNENK